MERRERELMKRLNTKIKTFYDEQLKRDEEVLSFLEKREENMEANMLKKVEGFSYNFNAISLCNFFNVVLFSNVILCFII